MKIRPLARSYSEVRTRHVLSRVLQRKGYRINPAVRLSDAVEADWSEWSGLDERDKVRFRSMHFDFVVTWGDRLIPQFVVEFDGPHHERDSSAAPLDALKNAFCQDAGLPMLRISSRDLEEHEKVSLLEWMLERWIAWQEEEPELRRKVDEAWRQVGGQGKTVDQLIDSGQAPASPEFYFDLHHPYPPILTVTHRLHALGIITLRASPDDVDRVAARRRGRLAMCSAASAGGGPAGACSRWTDYQAVVSRVDSYQRGKGCRGISEGEVLHRTVQRVDWRFALPVGWEAPNILSSEPPHGPHADQMEDQIEWMKWRIDALRHLWTSDLPGTSGGNLADGLAEYLVLRDVEEWASAHWPAPR